jgi:hypothetical protein
MLWRYLRILSVTVALLLVSATPALADIDSATATTTCSTYSLGLSASGLIAGASYTISYSIDVSPAASGFPLTGSISFVPSSGSFSDSLTGSFPALAGSFTFSGSALLSGPTKGDFIPRPITFSPSGLTCQPPPPPPPCSAQSTISSNFNGTPINGGSYIWFNANFSASGIPSSGATISLTNSTISFTQRGTQYQLPVPNAQVVFSPTATCSSTTFNTMTNTWTTTVPIKGDDEIFLTGLAWPVPAGGLNGGVNPVDWEGSFSTNGASGISLNWKWGAAAYSAFTTDYNALAVKSGHQTACGQSNGDHAGVPEGFNNSNRRWNEFVVGGARGGGGSNWTGSWSSTQSVAPACQSNSFRTGSSQPITSRGTLNTGVMSPSGIRLRIE